MPKTDIDYSNTIIYKITCNDITITDTYVGHTTNFVQRKHAHKNSCSNEKLSIYNCKLYKTIRQHGGWSNWTMEIINFFNCKDHYEARQKEQEYFELLSATLNSIEPLLLSKIITTNNNIKPLSISPINNENKQKLSYKYYCEECEYNTSKKFNYIKHISTPKHTEKVEPKVANFVCNICGIQYATNSGLWKHNQKCSHNDVNINVPNYTCNMCYKQYESRNGLWLHKKKCVVKIEQSNCCVNNNDKLIEYLIKENSEFKSLILELVKKDNNHSLFLSNNEN